MVQRVFGRTERTPTTVSLATCEDVGAGVVESTVAGTAVVERVTEAVVASAAVATTGGALVARGIVGTTVDAWAEVVSTLGAVVVRGNSTEGAPAFTGRVGASGVEVVTVSARGSTEAVAGALVEAGAAMVMFACSWLGRPGVDASGEVTRTVKSPVRGSREPRVGVVVETVLVESVVVKAAGSAPSEVTTVLSRNTRVVSTATSVASVGIEGGRSVQVVVAVKGLARKSSEVGAAVVETATPV